MRLGAHAQGVTRFVLDISGAMEFRVRLQADPYRVVIENDGFGWETEPVVRKAVGAISGLRYVEETTGGRLVLDLRQPAEVRSAFVLSPREGQGWRFVMDLKDTSRQAFLAAAGVSARQAAAAPPPPVRPVAAPAPAPPAPAPVAEAPAPPPPSNRVVVMSPVAETPPPAPAPVVAAPAPAPAPAPVPLPPPVRGGQMISAPMPPPPERPPLPGAIPMGPPNPAQTEAPPVTNVAAPAPAPEPEAKPARRRGDGRPTIVIDPGHGGVDPGAIGVSGTYEKIITLAMARDLKDHLERTGRYHVRLTRDRDVFIRLRDRISLARQYHADLFVSLHADVVKDPQIRGLSVYTLSQTASDGEAQALADKENKADLIAGIDLSHESADVANILIDLAQRETMNRSAVFASEIVEELGRETSLLGNTHRFAGFAVLKAPDVPAVLVEMGYLSNDVEERSLRQPEYRNKLSRAVTRAIDRFFLQGQKATR
jgi:N-acetylmuramoyl-L-alanine amidase